MADQDFTEADAVRVADAFETFRRATTGQMRPAGLGTIREGARRRRRWCGYRAAVIATVIVLLPSGIGLGLAQVGAHRTSPAPSPTGTPSPAPAPSPTASVLSGDVPACVDSDLSIAVIAGGVGLGTWRTLIGFTNISGRMCTIGGYPVVVALDRSGATVSGGENPASALVSPSYPAGALVTLAPGEQAGAEIVGGEIDARGQPCPPYQWLRVTAPGTYGAWEVSSFVPASGYAAVCGPFGVSSVYPRAAFQFSPQAFISSTTSESLAATPCQASQLSAHRTYAYSNASHPLTIVAFYNVSTSPCYLNGYVTIDATNAGGQAVPVSVTHGGNYYGSDPGPTRVDVPPGGAASFAVVSGTAYGGGAHVVTLTRLTLTLPGNGGQLQMATTISVTRPNETGPYPLSETALVAGTGGPNT
jgi:hypothetical protein